MTTLTRPLTRTGERPRADLVRVVMAGLFVLMAAGNAFSLVHRLQVPEVSAPRRVSDVLASVLTLAFCGLVVRAYLRRGPATATDRNPLVWLAAPAGTLLPMVLGAVPPRPGGAFRTVAELALTLSGLLFSVWAVRSLATNLSVVPQARGVVTSGPYRWVRHPLYLGEIVGVAGMALHVGRPWALALLLAEVGLQMYRAHREEQLLARELHGYADYAARTSRVIPGIW